MKLSFVNGTTSLAANAKNNQESSAVEKYMDLSTELIRDDNVSVLVDGCPDSELSQRSVDAVLLWREVAGISDQDIRVTVRSSVAINQ